MVLRLVKILLLGSYGLIMALDALDNVLVPSLGMASVRHVLSMDTTGGNPDVMWRAIDNGTIHAIGFAGIVIALAASAGLIFWGALRMLLARRQAAAVFERAKTPAIAGLGLAVAIWCAGFMGVGGYWFMMWLSSAWNATNGSFQLTVLAILVLVVLIHRDADPA